jgi:type I restriction enzyme S subunit
VSEWKECKLGEVIFSNVSSITASYPHKTIKYLDTGSITCGKLDLFQEISLQDAPSRAKRLVKNGSIVYSTVRPIQRHYGYIINPPENLVVSTGFSVIDTQPDLADPLFIYHLLASKDVVEMLDTIAEGSTSAYPSLKPSDIENLDILLPPLPEQKAIAAVLSSLDDKIDLLHRQNKTLETMAETLFRQWFVEEADEGWEEGKLGDLIELIYGKALKDELRTGSGYPVVGSSGIVGYHSDYLVNGPGIVIGRKGTLGKVVYLNDCFYPIDTTYYVKSKNESSELFYEYFLLKTIAFEDMNSDSAVPGLNRDIALSAELKIPPRHLILAFNSKSKSMMDKKELNNNQIRTLESLRDTLIPKLMSGEVRVQL